MKRRWNDHKAGLLAFLIVLLLMPLGHTLMVLNERLIHANKFTGALVIGALGAGLLAWGIRIGAKAAYATLLGLIAGVLVWTGWVEFSFVWIAEKLSVAPMIENGRVTTRPEYLVMMSSLGLLGSIMLMFLFGATRCTFFRWFQKRMGHRQAVKDSTPLEAPRPLAVIAFIETVMIIWTFYIVLLLIYDPAIAGDRHPLAYLVAFGSLFWSAHLFLRLIRIKAFDHAVRYAIPTVVIFWNFVEITGRWDLFKEIWVHPADHWLENSIILVLLLAFVVFTLVTRTGIGRRRPLSVVDDRPGPPGP